MEPRAYERYTPEKEIMVALQLPPEHQNWTFMGHMVDLSRSGLSFAYLPISTAIPVGTPCEIMLKYGSMPFEEPIACEPVYELDTETGRETGQNITYETPFSSETYSLPLMRRCGIKFMNPLSVSTFQELVSA